MHHRANELHVNSESASDDGAVHSRDRGTVVRTMLLAVMMRVTTVERDPEVESSRDQDGYTP